MNVTQLIQRTRDVVTDNATEPGAPRQWEDDELLRHLNGANDLLWQVALRADQNWGLDFDTLSNLGATLTDVGGGYVRIDLPPDFYTVRHIEELDNDLRASNPIRPLVVGDPGVSLSNLLYGLLAGERKWTPGAVQGEYLLYSDRGTPTADPTRIRVWYLRKPPALVRFRSTSYPTTSIVRATIGTSDQAAVGGLGALQARPNYYRKAVVQCSSFTGAATPQGLLFLVTASASATLPAIDLTFRNAHGLVAPAAAALFEIIPAWPEESHELLAWKAAGLALAKSGDKDGKRQVDFTTTEFMQAFVDRINAREVQQPRFVRELFSE